MALTRITKGVIKPNENYDTHNIVSTGIVTSVGLDVNGNADISGNLSVGGVLTYEDVTSIDSVGIITAQKDIHVGAGVSAVGVGTFGTIKVGTGVTIEGNGQATFVGVTTFGNLVGGATTSIVVNRDLILRDVWGYGNHIKFIWGTNTLNFPSASLQNIARVPNLSFGDRTNNGNQIGIGDFLLYHDYYNMHMRYYGANGNLVLSNKNTEIHISGANGSGSPQQSIRIKSGATEGVILHHGGNAKFETAGIGASVYGTLVATGADINGDLDVDGHTNLDNVSVAGVSTFSSILDATNTPASIRVAQDIQHKGDADTKITFPAADTISFETAGTERLRIASDGQNTIYSGAHDKGLELLATANSRETRFRIQGKASDGTEHNFYFNAKASGNRLDMSGTGPMCFIGTQNVGVQNANPTSPLHVGGSSNNSGAKATLFVGAAIGDGMFHLRGDSPTVFFDKSGSGYAKILTDGGALTISDGTLDNNGNERLRIGDSGGVGINTTLIRNNRFLNIAAPSQDFSNNSTELMDGGGICFQHTDSLASTNRTYPGIFWSGNTGSLGRARAGILGITASNNDATDIVFLTRTAANGTGFYPSDERMRIMKDGRVGIKFKGNYTMNSQSTDLVIGDGGGGRGITLWTAGAADNQTISFQTNETLSRAEGEISYGPTATSVTNDRNAMMFRTNSGERLRITSTGQLLLGETSAFDSNVAMQFRKDNAGNQSRFIFRNRGNNGNSRVRLIMSTLNRAANADQFSGMEKYQSGGMAIFNGESDTSHCNISCFAGNWQPITLKNGNVSGGDAMHARAYWGTSNGIQMEVGGPQSGTHKSIRFTTSHYGGERGYIGVTLGGTSYNSSSDYRMKQDVVDMTGAIDRVKLFLPKRFKWKEDPTYTVDGFLAHEASTVVPESVVGEKDAIDSNGDPEYQVMDNSKLVPVLTAALKEAIAKIEILEAKVAALEGS